MMTWTQALLPRRPLRPAVKTLLAFGWAMIAVVVWTGLPYRTLPGPDEVLLALSTLWWHGGLGAELLTTLRIIGHATLLAAGVSLAMAYASVVPLLRPLVQGVSKLRFLGVAGLTFPLTLLLGGGYPLKVALLTFGMGTFFVASMAQVVASVPAQKFDHARVLGASESRILWEVVVRGTLPDALEVLRQNVAMGWAMITAVEGISRAEGGIGAMALNQEKHIQLPEVYAVALVILLCGLGIDYLAGVLLDLLCPHARLDQVRK